MRPSMLLTLPSHSNFEAIQKEARELFHALQRKDFVAANRYCPFDLLDNPTPARLADAQYIIARRYGFRSWANLKERLLVRCTET
jgi:hypothetical protein